MNSLFSIMAITVVLVTLLLAFIRHRGVALPWWLDWLGATAAPVIAAIAGLMVGRWLFGRAPPKPPVPDSATAAPKQSTPALPPPEPPTNSVEQIVADSTQHLTQEPADDIHHQLHDKLSKYLD